MIATRTTLIVIAYSLLGAGAITGCAYSAAVFATLTGIWAAQRLSAAPQSQTEQAVSPWEMLNVSFA